MEYVFERKINYYETDKMGIVHHSNYIRFLEEARCEFLSYIDLQYSRLEELGIMIPVLGVKCDYKKHVTFDDIILIKCKITTFTGVRMIVNYELINKKTNELIMTAETKHCFTNNSLKPINLKKYNEDGYNKLINVLEKV